MRAHGEETDFEASRREKTNDSNHDDTHWANGSYTELSPARVVLQNGGKPARLADCVN